MSHILNVLKKLESEKKRHDKSIDLKDTLLQDEFVSDLKQKRQKFSPTFAAVTASLITMFILTFIISAYFFYASRNSAIALKKAAQTQVTHPQIAQSEQVARHIEVEEVKRIDSETGHTGIKKTELIDSEQKKVGVTLASVQAAVDKEKPKIKKPPVDVPLAASASKQKDAPQQSVSLKIENSTANKGNKDDSKQNVQEIQKPLAMKWRWEPLNKERKTDSENLSPKKEDLADTDSPKKTSISNWQGGLSSTSEQNQKAASEKAASEKTENRDDIELTSDSEPVPSLRIRGAIFISEGSRANYVVFDYNGQSHKLKEGESADQLTLVKIYSNKAMFRFKNKAFYRHF